MFSSASVSACEVDDVAATAAGAAGLRAGGGRAACCRVAGAMAVAAGAVFFAAVLATGVVLGTTLRAIGRAFGNGTFGLAAASAVNADNPTASARKAVKTVAKPAVRIVDRNAAARADGITAFPDGESFNRSSLRSS
jgi:hypothetical protein